MKLLCAGFIIHHPDIPSAVFIEDINSGKNTLFASPVYFEYNEGDDKFLEVAIQYNDGYTEQIFPFSNNIRQPDGGTHLEGFKAALTKVINDAGHRLNILKENDKLSGEDVREGITAVVSVKIADAQYESQTKAKLCSTVESTAASRLSNSVLRWK